MALIQDSTDPRFLSQYAGGSSPAIPATPVATNIPVSEITPTNPMTVPVSNSGLNDFNAIMAGTNVSLPVPVNPEEAAVKKNQSDILSKMTELGGQGAYQAELESDPTLQGNKKDLMDLQSQLMSLNNEAQAAALNVDRQGRPAVLTAAANLEKGNIERDRTIKALRLSSSIQALQGNISLAQDQIDTAIKRKYEPIKAQLDVLNKQLEFNYDTFTAAEKKRADQLKFENDIKMDEINKREDADKRFESLKIQALSNGMSATQAQQAQALYEAGQTDQAYANMSRYTGSKSADVNTGAGGTVISGTVPEEVPKALTQAQLGNKLFYDRTTQADAIINEVGGAFTGLGSYFGSYLPNVLKSDDRQRLEQAQRNFVNALLRRESGAAISSSEFDNAARQYFPQPGDSKAVLLQKAQNRKTVTDGLALQSGLVKKSNTDPLGIR